MVSCATAEVYFGSPTWQIEHARSGKTYEREHVPRICYVKLYASRGVSETISS
jgi:hypothetical protein